MGIDKLGNNYEKVKNGKVENAVSPKEKESKSKRRAMKGGTLMR